MKKKLTIANLVSAVLTLIIACLFSACLKKSDADLKPSVSIPFKAKDLIKTLSGQSSLHLFYLAFNRLSLSSSIDTNTNYTIFAPTDSAMKAVGLDSAGINRLNIDSLRKLITYQIGIGAFGDNTLSNSASTEVITTLKKDFVTTPTGGSTYKAPVLFIKESGSLYFNGIPITKTGQTIQTFNGYIYPVSGFAPSIPSRTIYDVINSDPDLSMYKQALMIQDSVLIANSMNPGDLQGFEQPGDPYAIGGVLPTVLAPTNKAFNDAGFHTTDDLVRYATRYYVGLNYNDFTTYYYSSIDTLLRHHVLHNSNAGAVRILYNDLLNPAVNNGVFNTYRTGTYYSDLVLTTVPLIFSAVNGTVYVKGTNDPNEKPVILPHDASPLHPVNNFICSNGALYKIDKLFPLPK